MKVLALLLFSLPVLAASPSPKVAPRLYVESVSMADGSTATLSIGSGTGWMAVWVKDNMPARRYDGTLTLKQHKLLSEAVKAALGASSDSSACPDAKVVVTIELLGTASVRTCESRISPGFRSVRALVLKTLRWKEKATKLGFLSVGLSKAELVRLQEGGTKHRRMRVQVLKNGDVVSAHDYTSKPFRLSVAELRQVKKLAAEAVLETAGRRRYDPSCDYRRDYLVTPHGRFAFNVCTDLPHPSLAALITYLDSLRPPRGLRAKAL